jgi:Cu-Zn family superoxide dismutase
MKCLPWLCTVLSSLASTLPVTGTVQAHEGEYELVMFVKRVTASGPAEEVGRIYFRDTKYGLIIAPHLQGLTPGPHGAHLHEFPSCASHADSAPGGAGNHYDPARTGRHAGPYENGHLGDLPNLIADADGISRIPMLAPRVKLADIRNRALIIHAGADLYDMDPVDKNIPATKTPAAHQGRAEHDHAATGAMTGGDRMYCGVAQEKAD